MQNLLLKSLVLTGVIGGSCFIVWLANENLQKTQSETDPSQFAALDTEEQGEATTEDDLGFEDIDLTPESAPPAEASSTVSTIPRQSEEEDGPQPTLAKTDTFVPMTSSKEPEVVEEPVFLPENFESQELAETSTAPPAFPGAVSHGEVPDVTPTPVMPLTFYPAGGKKIPKVDLALNEETNSERERAILPVSAEETVHSELPRELAEQQELAHTEVPSLRFGPSANFESGGLSAPAPVQMQEEGGIVQLPARNSEPLVLPSSELPTPSEEPNELALATPLQPIHKNGLTVGEVEQEIDNSISNVAPRENPFAKYRNRQSTPGPNDAIVRTSGETQPSVEPELGANPFAKFQNQPIRTANVETVEPSEIGFNAPPPQPSAPEVASDPFGTNTGSGEVMPVRNQELAQNQPVPEELLPPIAPTSFNSEIELDNLPVLPEPVAVTEIEDSVLPTAAPPIPVLAEPTPLPTAERPAFAESEDVFPGELPPSSNLNSNAPVIPSNPSVPAIAQPEESWSSQPTEFDVTPPPLNRELPQPEIAPVGNSNLAQDELFPADVPRNVPATATFNNEEPADAVMPVEFGNEPVLAPPATPVTSFEPTPTVPTPMTITPRESIIPVVSEPTVSEVRTNPEIHTFHGPANSELEEDYDRSISSTPQSPELKIEKIAPEQASIGEPLIYAIRIQNVGGSEARSVVVEDRIPRGTRLEGTIPQAVLTNEKLTWDLGIVPPGEERTIQLKVIPLQAGDIGSVATVSFEAAVAATIRVTAPELSVQIDGPSETLLGKNVPYKFTVKNTGQGNAKDVVLRAVLPPSLKHPNGSDIEANLDDIPAGESRTVDLVVVADAVGVFTPEVLIWMNGKDVAKNRADLRILESRLRLSRTGPKRRFVGRPAEFVTEITNDSSIALTNITVEEQLPISLEPATQISGWNPQRRVIQRVIPALQPGETRKFSTQLIPNQAGELTGKIVVHDQAGNQANIDTPLSVKGFADLAVDIYGENKFVVVGDQVSFRLNLKNDGTATANNVQAEFEIPQGLTFAAATGPSTYQVVGNKVQFAAVDQIPVNAEKSYDIVLTAAEECNTKVKIALHSAEYSEPINREEPVRVVSDAP